MNRADDSSEDLMARVARGSDEALTTLMRRFATPLLTFIQRMIGDRQQAEELFQEVFLSVWTRRHQYRYPSRFQSWLFAIALNRCRADFRRPRLATVTLDDQPVWEPAAPDPSPAQAAIADERAALVAAAVADLPARQRTVVVLRIYNGMQYGEIGDVMGLRTATVRSHMLHGLAALRRSLQPRLE
jgi:RNA polymerase sigma-70 factor (ECF subfamily)